MDLFGAGPGRPGPAVIFNATNSETGKRVLFANIDAGVIPNDYLFPLSTPGVRDLLGDVTVGEIVHLSARFPFISPPASLQMLVPTASSQKSAFRLWGHVVDGGYFDNSGGLALRDVYESLTQLRDAAFRGEGFSSADADVDWERARPLVARARFHIVVIRNDPLNSADSERSDYPTLSDDRLANLSGDAITKAWDGGDFSRSTPTQNYLSELLAPFDTMLSTREARASATRRALWERVTKQTHDQQYQCELDRLIATHAAAAIPLTVSPECLDFRVDRYTEISLGEIIAGAAQQPTTEKVACDFDDARSVALGWMLAERSKRAMSCLAANDPGIGELAAEFSTSQ